MVARVNRSRTGENLRGLFGALLWTGIVITGFLLVDRAFFGPSITEGWNRFRTLGDVPAEVASALPPPYLPNSVLWPPARVYYRVKPAPGWWLGLSDVARSEVLLWLGTGSEPLPRELEALQPCLDERTISACPAGWRFSSARVNSEVIFLLSKLEPQENKRILIGLERPVDH